MISIFVTYFFVGKQLFSSIESVLINCVYGFAVGISIWKVSVIAGIFIKKHFPWERNPRLTLRVSIITSVLCSSAVIIVVNVLFYKYVYKISIRSEFSHILIEMVIEFGIAMLLTTIYYLKQFFIFWRNAAINEEKYKQEALSLQYETLKSYVNPHFLFNSLSVLSSLVEKDTVKSQLFIKQLSDIYRYVLEQKDKELVALSTELTFARSFIDLHRIRHGDNLQVEVNVENTNGAIMPLSMQILLENAFKHNIISSEEPLLVKIGRQDDYMIVQNRVQIRRTIDQPGGLGLDTIVKRYAFFTDKKITITSDDGWFTVKIPILALNLIG
jgi:sensor histidine kinase YesM